MRPVSRWQSPTTRDSLDIFAKYGTPGSVNNLGDFPAVTNLLAQPKWSAPQPINAQGDDGMVPVGAQPENGMQPPEFDGARPNAWQRGELEPAARGTYSALDDRPTVGERWGTALDAPAVSRNALGPRALARREQRMAGRGGGRGGYGNYQ